ncbi:MAG: protein-S-isoprenylcysteine methyltransferase [bacterium]
MEYFIASLLWIGYCALHSFLICTWFTNILSRTLKSYYAFYRLFYVVFSVVLLIPLINYTDGINQEIIIKYEYPWSIVRYVFMYGSLLLFFWAFFFDYDSLSFFGIRQIMNRNKLVPPGEIKKKGLLGMMRHPMYLALIIFLLSTTLTMVNIIINALLILYVFIGTIIEEKKLVLEFGEAYKKYQNEVPMLIPFAKRKISINQ